MPAALQLDLVKPVIIRLALAQAEEFRLFNVVRVALSPGFLRSEAMLDRFGAKESNARDAIAKDPNFAVLEIARYIGRAVVRLAPAARS